MSKFERDAKILEMAVAKAVQRGWRQELKANELISIHKGNKSVGLVLCIPDIQTHTKQHIGQLDLIFDSTFAYHLWGAGIAQFIKGHSGDTIHINNIPNWKGHLANMAAADDRILYLGENI